jgi:hypothetical protein
VRATLDEQSNIRSRQQLVSLLQRFRFVRQCIKCSAKNLLKVQDVFVKAQQAVLYPFSPLFPFSLSTGTLTTDCQKALTRIFRNVPIVTMTDCLSNAESDAFQYHTFKLPLVDRDLQRMETTRHPATETMALQQQHQVIMLQDGNIHRSRDFRDFRCLYQSESSRCTLESLSKIRQYTNNLELTIPPQKFNINSVSKLTKADCKFLAALFQQFVDTNGKGYPVGEKFGRYFFTCSWPWRCLPWHPMRADTLLKGCFSVPVFWSRYFPRACQQGRVVEV